MKKITKVTVHWNGRYLFLGHGTEEERHFVVSEPVKKFLESWPYFGPKDVPAAFLLSTTHAFGEKLTFVGKSRRDDGEIGNVCYYSRSRYQWEGVLTICDDALFALFDRVPKTIYVSRPVPA